MGIDDNQESERQSNKDVLVVGDCFYEQLSYGEKEVATIEGGAWFVQRFMRKALGSTGINVNGYESGNQKVKKIAAVLTVGRKGKKYRFVVSPTAELTSIEPDDSADADDAPGEFNYDPTAFTIGKLANSQNAKHILVIDDMDMGYRKSVWKKQGKSVRADWIDLLNLLKGQENTGEYKIVALINRGCPSFSPEALECAKQETNLAQDGSVSLWDKLLLEHSEHTIIIVNADWLRAEGLSISRRLSWERTAQDFVCAMSADSRVSPLTKFGQLIVRFGVTGAIQCVRRGDKISYTLHYDSGADDGIFRDVDSDGAVIGNNSAFAAAMVKSLHVAKANDEIERISEGIRAGLKACQQLHTNGYPKFEKPTDHLDSWPSEQIFHATEAELHEVVSVEIPKAISNWSIVKQSLIGAKLLEFAEDTVYGGIESAVREKGLPKGKFGKLITLDREEIESLRGIQNIVRRYLSNDKDRKPLCIAVFGPPGSGKSFAVREILKDLVYIETERRRDEEDAAFKKRDKGRSRKRKDREINVSGLTTPQELYNRLARVVRERIVLDLTPEEDEEERKRKQEDEDRDREMPILFFDEFDCESTSYLGWLKCFLGLMEDAKFAAEIDDKPEIFDLERSILVFAGGTKKTYLDFCSEDSSIGEKERLLFKTAKGPDFVSRLRGHVDIKGINKLNADDTTYIVRRALLLRNFAETYNLCSSSKTSGQQEANIDPSIVFAMLKTSSYKHGARSMQALVSMFVPLHGKVQRSSVPFEPLLNMHVNGNEFRALVEEYQYSRRQPSGTDIYVCT